MKQLFLLLGFVCLIAMLLPACAPAPEPEPSPEPVFDQAAEEAAIREVLNQGLTALNAGDLKTALSQFDKDYEDWRGTTKGLAAWEKSNSEFFERQKNVRFKTLEEIGIIFVTPEVAIYRDRHEVSGLVDEEGKQLPPEIRLWAAVYVKKNGRWLRRTQFVARGGDDF